MQEGGCPIGVHLPLLFFLPIHFKQVALERNFLNTLENLRSIIWNVYFKVWNVCFTIWNIHFKLWNIKYCEGDWDYIRTKRLLRASSFLNIRIYSVKEWFSGDDVWNWILRDACCWMPPACLDRSGNLHHVEPIRWHPLCRLPVRALRGHVLRCWARHSWCSRRWLKQVLFEQARQPLPDNSEQPTAQQHRSAKTVNAECRVTLVMNWSKVV